MRTHTHTPVRHVCSAQDSSPFYLKVVRKWCLAFQAKHANISSHRGTNVWGAGTECVCVSAPLGRRAAVFSECVCVGWRVKRESQLQQQIDPSHILPAATGMLARAHQPFTMHPCVHPNKHPCIHRPSINPIIHPSKHTNMDPCIIYHPSIHPSIYASIHLSLHVCTPTYIHASICDPSSIHASTHASIPACNPPSSGLYLFILLTCSRKKPKTFYDLWLTQIVYN